jgi:hypothetical protein
MPPQANSSAGEPKTKFNRAGYWIAHCEYSNLLTWFALVGGLAALVAATILNSRPFLAGILLAVGIFLLCCVRLSWKVKKTYAAFERWQSQIPSKSSDE